jgi:hypothetical protein
MWPNQITGPNAGGPRQLPIWTPLAARAGQLWRWGPKMKKNIVIVISWCIAIGLLLSLWWLWQQFAFQNSSLRNLRADLWRQQVSMREKQLAIAKRIKGVDENMRRDVIDLLMQSATEVDVLRDQNNIWNGKEELAKLMKQLKETRPQPPAGGDGKPAPQP